MITARTMMDPAISQHGCIELIETFPAGKGPLSSHSENVGSLMVYRRDSGEPGSVRYLVFQSRTEDDVISHVMSTSPDVAALISDFLDRHSISVNLLTCTVSGPDGVIESPEADSLIEALSVISIFPRRTIDTGQGGEIVSVILSGGKGSRMRSRDLHKVCFPVNGRPAITRLLDQLSAVGVNRHIVVVGSKGEQVVREITDVRDDVTFVYQLHPNGTGNAAKQAVYLLRSQGYTGQILLIPGDKVIELSALKRLIDTAVESKADCALMTAEKSLWPGAGRIVYDRRGRVVDIVEWNEIIRMMLSQNFLDCVDEEAVQTEELINDIDRKIPSDESARTVFPVLYDVLAGQKTIDCQELRRYIDESDTVYTVERDGDPVTFSGNELESAATTVNASVYHFTADAFYRSVPEIAPGNERAEEYVTDIARILSRDTERNWKVIPVPVRDQYEVMSYNNPEELLNIEQYYIRKESRDEAVQRSSERIDVASRKHALRPVKEWLGIFTDNGEDVRRLFREMYDDNPSFHQERRCVYIKTLEKFMRVFGANQSVIIARSPGRVNLMGRHVEHRGGYTNYMTINRETLLVAGIHDDDIISIHNMESSSFRPRQFSIGGELSRLPWDDWLNMIDSKTVLNMIHSSRGDWSNYFKAAALRLQEKYRGRLLFGFNGVLTSDIPMAAGLSSSSSVVVSAAEVLTFINGLSFVPREFVDLCGESEWFVGTRGGSGDHAAMKFGEKGRIIHMGFHEIRVEDVLAFPEKYRLVILQSHQHARKSEGAMQIFNEKVATYEVAQSLVRHYYPDLRDKILYFRDMNSENLGLDMSGMYDMFLRVPDRITRHELADLLDDEEYKRLERIFSSHEEPENGYEARRVMLYGLAEIERARQFARYVKAGEIERAGLLMNNSHDGDRVSVLDSSGNRIAYDNSFTDEDIARLKSLYAAGDERSALYYQPGGYGCSTPLIDEIVDNALSCDGVIGVQLSGAGLGGCIMALVREDAVTPFLDTMRESFYDKHRLPENMLVCSPVAGSGIVSL